jgi:hypothetical protein
LHSGSRVAGHVAQHDVSPRRKVDDDVRHARSFRLEVNNEPSAQGLLVDGEPVGTKRQPAGPGMDDHQLVGDRASVLDADEDVSSLDLAWCADVEVTLGDREDWKDTMGRAAAAAGDQKDDRSGPDEFLPHWSWIGKDPGQTDRQNDVDASPFSGT